VIKDAMLASPKLSEKSEEKRKVKKHSWMLMAGSVQLSVSFSFHAIL
jgi:hypothetical protein